MTKIMINLFGYDRARAITTRTYDGERWYMASTVCSLLGIDAYSYYVNKYLTSKERKKKTEYTGTSKRHILWINESGFYKLLQVVKTKEALEIMEKTKEITSPLRPISWPEEKLAA